MLIRQLDGHRDEKFSYNNLNSVFAILTQIYILPISEIEPHLIIANNIRNITHTHTHTHTHIKYIFCFQRKKLQYFLM